MAVTGTSTGVLRFTASGDMVDGVHVLGSCRWIGATTAGHRCSFTDSTGNVIFESQADGPNYTDGWVFEGKWANGITVASLQSGILDIYVSSRG